MARDENQSLQRLELAGLRRCTVQIEDIELDRGGACASEEGQLE
uniref:Uncharacterized protein n=1 Tax=Arundo donax TaxID=35708 RepID=A0A0A8YLC2_ARUDO